jgi:hypothetical protein
MTLLLIKIKHVLGYSLRSKPTPFFVAISS